MSAITLTGTVIKTYVSPNGEKDGQKYGGDTRLQLMAMMPLKNGETKAQLIDLVIEDHKAYLGAEGTVVTLPVALYVSQGRVAFSMAK